MSLNRENDDDKVRELYRLNVNEDMTIYAIEALKQEISAELDFYKKFELNLANVEEIDSAGIQLLLALRSELKAKNKELKLTAISPVVAKLMAVYGISDLFTREVQHE